MKKILLVLALALFSLNGTSQEVFKKSFWIPEKISFEDGKTILLMETNYWTKSQIDSLANSSDKEIKKIYEKKLKEIQKSYPMGKKINFYKKDSSLKTEITIKTETSIDNVFFEDLLFKMETPYVGPGFDRGNLKMKEEKVYVNPYLIMEKEISRQEERISKSIDIDEINQLLEKNDSISNSSEEESNYTRKTYYYELKNRQSIKIPFSELFISAVTLPIKYRFGSENGDIEEDFASDINVNVLFGFSLGRKKFMYRKNVDNLERETKWLMGLFIGTSSIEFNTNNTLPSLDANETFRKGVLSYGFGTGISIGKFQGTVFGGWDNAVGNQSDLWNYDNKFWIGLGLGFEIID
ncbi:hypothetical protein [Gramella sp. MAR_2010_147]|uniref:hypothetical protein n=1 Tax=Gramella sp. MAR_2010_147 TaxID=1250205 RepID=UPI00087DC910|nr:hypothetical protein [Gramella sp. MAR_2010_147]SDS13440.1 hypothetical protein SAMN04488553_1552 [Gramella sp. MAR_2010_147]